jgi:serine/threonine protein kinase
MKGQTSQMMSWLQYDSRFCLFLNSSILIPQIKLESKKTKYPQLFYEYKLYKILQGGNGIPSVFWFGVEGDFNVMVMELLGKSLEDHLQMCAPNLSNKSGIMLAMQMLRRLGLCCVIFNGLFL